MRDRANDHPLIQGLLEAGEEVEHHALAGDAGHRQRVSVRPAASAGGRPRCLRGGVADALVTIGLRLAQAS